MTYRGYSWEYAVKQKWIGKGYILLNLENGSFADFLAMKQNDLVLIEAKSRKKRKRGSQSFGKTRFCPTKHDCRQYLNLVKFLKETRKTNPELKIRVIYEFRLGGEKITKTLGAARKMFEGSKYFAEDSE